MFGDFGKMLKIASQVKAKMPEIREKIESSTHTAEAGGGAVSATVGGKMELVDLRIAPELLAEADAALVEDAVKAAVAAAQKQAAEFARDAMLELTGGEQVDGLNDMLGL
jgi:nucleoid-associated protein EbfC